MLPVCLHLHYWVSFGQVMLLNIIPAQWSIYRLVVHGHILKYSAVVDHLTEQQHLLVQYSICMYKYTWDETELDHQHHQLMNLYKMVYTIYRVGISG